MSDLQKQQTTMGAQELTTRVFPVDSRDTSPVRRSGNEPAGKNVGVQPVFKSMGADVAFQPAGGGGRTIPYASAYALVATARGSLGTSDVDGIITLKGYFKQVIRTVPDLSNVAPDDFDAFRFALADDAIRNLSSTRDMTTHDQYVGMIIDGDRIDVKRSEFYRAMFGKAPEDSFLTRAHRGVKAQISMLLADGGYRRTLEEAGIYDVKTRMDYLGLGGQTNRVHGRADREMAVKMKLNRATDSNGE